MLVFTIYSHILYDNVFIADTDDSDDEGSFKLIHSYVVDCIRQGRSNYVCRQLPNRSDRRIFSKAAMLEDTVAKKSIILHNKYLYKLIVRKGDFVAPGSPLAQVEDASKAKLVLFLELEELEEIDRKTVYIDGKKTNYKVNKIWKIADEKFISSYRAEIYIPAPKSTFSKLVKVEIK